MLSKNYGQLELPFKEKKRMNNLNSVLLEGELSADPLFNELRNCSFNIGVYRQEKTNYFKVILAVTWQKFVPNI